MDDLQEARAVVEDTVFVGELLLLIRQDNLEYAASEEIENQAKPDVDNSASQVVETPQVVGVEEVGRHIEPAGDDFSFIRQVFEDRLFCPFSGSRFAKKTNTKCHPIEIHEVPASALDLLG